MRPMNATIQISVTDCNGNEARASLAGEVGVRAPRLVSILSKVCSDYGFHTSARSADEGDEPMPTRLEINSPQVPVVTVKPFEEKASRDALQTLKDRVAAMVTAGGAILDRVVALECSPKVNLAGLTRRVEGLERGLRAQRATSGQEGVDEAAADSLYVEADHQDETSAEGT